MRLLSRPSLALVAAVLSLAPLGVARAQASGNVDLQTFHPAIDSRGYITVNASQILGHKELSFGLVTNWAIGLVHFEADRGALGAEYVDGNRSYVVSNLISPTLQAAFGIAGVFELGLTLPFAVVQGDVGPDYVGDPNTANDNDKFNFDAQGIGDAGAHAKIRILNTSKHPLGLAVLLSAYLPAHDQGKWLGESALTLQPTLIVDKEWRGGIFRLAANVGMRLRTAPAADLVFTNSDIPAMAPTPLIPGTNRVVEAPKSEIPFGLGASYAISKQSVDLIAEIIGSMPLGGENYFPLEGLVGFKFYLARNSFFEIGAGAGFMAKDKAANPDFRAFIGIVFEPNIGDRDSDGIKDDVDKCPDDPEDYDDFEDQDGCPEPDNDKDGILDEDDQCPNEPEDKDGVDDEDGCPDADDNDRDGDGILDDVDQCPDDPEDKDQFQDEDGCPDIDNDKDGILDVDDLCPNDPEDKDNWEDKDGCPDPDNDKDRILDGVDKCPNEPETYNGHEDEDGCPDKGRVIVKTGSIEILDKIYFETDKAIIKPESFPILDAIAGTLVGNPDILKVEIGGHADERGSDERNQRLTQDRSDSVMKYLVDKGVKENRLKAVGYGESKPVDRGHSESAWSKNRRVEFVILQRAGAL